MITNTILPNITLFNNDKLCVKDYLKEKEPGMYFSRPLVIKMLKNKLIFEMFLRINGNTCYMFYPIVIVRYDDMKFILIYILYK